MTSTELLLSLLDQAYDRRSWHGTNLRGSIRGLTAAAAGWRPGPGRPSIHEIVLHAAYWKYVVRRQFTGEPRGSFSLEGSNWFRRARGDDKAWRDAVRLLDVSHQRLRAAIGGLDERELSRTARGRSVSNLALVSGIIAHDLYHAGQIQLLKKLRSTAVRRAR